MKNILLLVHQDAGEEARLKVAIDLTRALSGHLICIDITPFPIVFDQGMSLAPAFILDEAKREEVNKADLQRRIESEKISWNWDDITDDFVPALIEVATRADIVVLNRKLDTTARPNMRSITSSVLMHTNALVVAVGEHSRGIQLDCPALVAWDGSAQASLALERALPLLKKASLVTIFQLGDLPEESVTAKEAAEYLSRQKVASQIEIAPASNEIAAEICLAATRVGATYCVMGAFGHSAAARGAFRRRYPRDARHGDPTARPGPLTKGTLRPFRFWRNVMATQPDRIFPQSPPETIPDFPIPNAPGEEPPGFEPPHPDVEFPAPDPQELPSIPG